MSGYVRLHRTLLGHPAFRNEAETMFFAWLILKAAWRPVRVRYKGHSISLQRGQLAASVRDMADAHDRNKNWISRVLATMRSEDMIQSDAGTGVLVITICNYDDYQADAAEGGTADGTPQGTDEGQRRDSGGTQNKEEKEVKNNNNRASALPRAWQPEAFGEGSEAGAIVGSWSPAELKSQREAFHDYHKAKGTTSKDWQASWGTWVRNSRKFERSKTPESTGYVYTPPRLGRRSIEELTGGLANELGPIAAGG